jgi:hypothetical protein
MAAWSWADGTSICTIAAVVKSTLPNVEILALHTAGSSASLSTA